MFEEEAKVINSSPFHYTPLVDLYLAFDFSCRKLSINTTTICINATKLE